MGKRGWRVHSTSRTLSTPEAREGALSAAPLHVQIYILGPDDNAGGVRRNNNSGALCWCTRVCGFGERAAAGNVDEGDRSAAQSCAEECKMWISGIIIAQHENCAKSSVNKQNYITTEHRAGEGERVRTRESPSLFTPRIIHSGALESHVLEFQMAPIANAADSKQEPTSRCA